MSAGQETPPWLREKLAKFRQAEYDLRSVQAQKQQLNSDKMSSDAAMEELKKAADDQVVYRHTGTILVRTSKADLVSSLEERALLATTRQQVLDKQEKRLAESLKEQEESIRKMLGGGAGPQPGAQAPPRA